MTDAITAPLQPDAPLPWPRALKVHVIYCIVQMIAGSLLTLMAVASINTNFTMAQISKGLSAFSDHHVDLYFSLIVISYGILFTVTHLFGITLVFGRGTWRWRLWLMVGGLMAAVSPFSPFTLALGIPALILWSLQSTRLYLERERS